MRDPNTNSGSSVQPNLISDSFCSDGSRQRGEELWGIATRVDVWLLLEYGLPCGRNASEGSSLAGQVKARSDELVRAIPNSRLIDHQVQEPA
jgi:hypothetical protein